MPKQGLTEIIVVMDKSGSMAGIRDDAIGAFNTFLEDQQKQSGEARLPLTLFDAGYHIIQVCSDIQNVQKLNTSTYIPGGFTALLDAVGRTIDEVGKRLSDMAEEERPERVVMAIITDGQENSSKEYNRKIVTDKIKLQEETYKWEIVFLAAGLQAMAEAQNIGIRASNRVGFEAGSAVAYTKSVKNLSVSIGNYRQGTAPDWQAHSEKTPLKDPESGSGRIDTKGPNTVR